LGLNLEQKKSLVAEVAGKLARAQAVLVAENRGLDVAAVTGFRARARSAGVYVRVLKNTLARRAVRGTPFEPLAERFVGPLFYGIAENPVAGARLFAEFAREQERFVIRGGAMPTALMSEREVQALATMPSRAELLARLVGTLQAPIAGFVRTLAEVPARFARTLAAVRDAKAQAS